jgi:cytolysin-activating lysine-acyltransferase
MTDTTTTNKTTSDGAMTPEQAAQFSAQLKAQAQHVVSKLPLLGAVAWLMLQHNTTRHSLISDLEWRVMPPLVLDQAKLYMRDNAPVAYVSWAKLSEAVAGRYCTAPHQLAAGDWQSGAQIWIVDLYAPFGGAIEVLQDLRDTVLKGQVIHQLALGADAKLLPTVLNAG